VHVYSADRPEIHDVIADMRRVSDEFPARVLIGEIYLPVERLVAYYGKDLSGAHLPFNFALISAQWHAREIEDLIARYEAVLPPGAWPNWVLGNHDKPRLASRIGPEQARVAAMLLLTLRGTPTLYYGDEIGMPQVAIAPEDVRDPFEKNVPGIGVGRDGCRTPMQWDAGAYAGFSQVPPWLPLASGHVQHNVVNLDADAKSILSLYRLLIALRRKRPELARGNYEPLVAEGDLLLYRRSVNGRFVTVALNLGSRPLSIIPTSVDAGREILLSTLLDRHGEKMGPTLELRANEGVIVGEPDHAG
jgi:alpha-glucosidase